MKNETCKATAVEIPNTWGGKLYMVTMPDGTVYQGRADSEAEAIRRATARAEYEAVRKSMLGANHDK